MDIKNYFSLTTEGNEYSPVEILKYMHDKYEEKQYMFYPLIADIKATLVHYMDPKSGDTPADFSLNAPDSEYWIDFDDEMLELSKAFPRTVFYLHGQSEENELWCSRYRNGQKQYAPATITYEFEDFDEETEKNL